MSDTNPEEYIWLQDRKCALVTLGYYLAYLTKELRERESDEASILDVFTAMFHKRFIRLATGPERIFQLSAYLFRKLKQDRYYDRIEWMVKEQADSKFLDACERIAEELNQEIMQITGQLVRLQEEMVGER